MFRRRRDEGESGYVANAAPLLDKQARYLLEACANEPFFLDLGHVTPEVARVSDGRDAFEYLANLARQYRLALIPVTGLSRRTEYQSSVERILAKDARGLCLRISAT